MQQAEQNYEIYNKELLTVVEAITKWRQYLLDATVSRSLTVDFILFSLFIFILLYFSFSFNFLFLEQLGLGFISHAVTSVTN